MKYELPSGIVGNVGIIDDLTVRDAALVYDFNQDKLGGVEFTTETLQDFRDEHVNILMSILEARGGHRISDVDVLIFTPEKPEPLHPFQMNDVRLFLPTYKGREPRNTDLYELAQTRVTKEHPNPDSRKVREIIGAPNQALVEDGDRTAYRLVKELTALRKGLAIANDSEIASYQAIIAILGEKLLRLWVSGNLTNLTLGHNKSENYFVFKATAPRVEPGQSKPKVTRLKAKEKWVKLVGESKRRPYLI